MNPPLCCYWETMLLDSFSTNASTPRVQALGLIALALSLLTTQGCQSGKSDGTSKKSESQDVPAPKAIEPEAGPLQKSAEAKALPFLLDELSVSCGRICETTKTLACKRHAECQNGCIQAFGTPACVAELRRFLTCTESSPTTSFECSPEGIPILKDGVCDSEQETVMGCFARMTQ
jgi:hypothetical protein